MRFPSFFKIIFFLFSFVNFAAQASDFENGVQFSKEKNWAEAEKSFRSCIEKNPLNANAFYNLGTTLAAQQQEAEGIWALEKAIKLNPRFKEAKTNLQYCYAKLGIQETWEPALPYFQDKAYQLGIDFWTYTSIALVLVLAVFIFVSLVSAKSNTKKVTVIFSILILAVLFFTLKSALNSHHFKYNETHVVLMQDENSVFEDNTGNKRIDLQLKKGNRYEIDEIANDRIGLLMKNQSVVWIEDGSVKFI